MSKLLKYLFPFSFSIILLLVLVYGQTQVNLILPDYMAKIINQGIIKEDLGYIWQTGLWMLLIALGGGVCMVGVNFFASKIATGFTMKLRDVVFTKVESFSLLEFNHFSTASLITRCTNDLQQIQTVLVMLLRLAFMAPFMGVGAIIKAYHLAPSMSWLMWTAILVLTAVIAFLMAFALPKTRLIQKLVDKLNLVTREILTGLRVIRAFNKETQEEQKFADANAELTAANLTVNRLMVIMMPMMMLIMNFTTIGVIWVGAHMIDAGTLQIGDMLAYLQYAMQAIMAFLMISIVFVLVPRASVSAGRVAEILDIPVTIKDPELPQSLPKSGGRVEFKDVEFHYKGSEEPVLSGINFTAEPGQTTAIVGSTGCGKTTLVNLIPRLYDVSAGEVLVNGVNVKAVHLEELYSRIGYVPQKAMLFSGTVTSNIKYGAPTIEQAEVEVAAQIAQATEFIKEFEQKFDSPINQGGTNVSGGQKQRLSIARALARDPEIFIFDDSFSALDYKTDRQLREALKPITKGKTVLIVAQRISTIMQADKIIVLEGGKIIGEGTHHQLVHHCPVYQEIAASQLTEAELAEIDQEEDA